MRRRRVRAPPVAGRRSGGCSEVIVSAGVRAGRARAMALQGRGRGSRLEALLVRKLSEAERAVQRALPLRVREGGLPTRRSRGRRLGRRVGRGGLRRRRRARHATRGGKLGRRCSRRKGRARRHRRRPRRRSPRRRRPCGSLRGCGRSWPHQGRCRGRCRRRRRRCGASSPCRLRKKPRRGQRKVCSSRWRRPAPRQLRRWRRRCRVGLQSRMLGRRHSRVRMMAVWPPSLRGSTTARDKAAMPASLHWRSTQTPCSVYFAGAETAGSLTLSGKPAPAGTHALVFAASCGFAAANRSSRLC